MASLLPKIQLVRIAHVYYKYADLEKAREFLLDFGFTEEKRVNKENSEGEVEKIYFRGYGTEPWVLCATKSDEPEFGGAAFVVETEEDLRVAAETLPGASSIYELTDAPGGGRCVTFHDPVDGWPMHLVHGQRSASRLDIALPHAPVNYVSRTSLSSFPYTPQSSRGRVLYAFSVQDIQSPYPALASSDGVEESIRE